MGVLEGLKPERVFYYFEEICNCLLYTSDAADE